MRQNAQPFLRCEASLGPVVGVMVMMHLVATQTPLPRDGRLLVTPLVAREGVEHALAELTTDLLVSQLRRLVGERVVAQKEVQLTMELERLRRTTGADVVKDAVDVAASLAAPEVITGTISKVGASELQLTVFRVLTLDARLIATATRRFSSDHQEVLVELMPAIALELMQLRDVGAGQPVKPPGPTSQEPASAPTATRDEGSNPGLWATGGVLLGAGGGLLGGGVLMLALVGTAAFYGARAAAVAPVFTAGAWLGLGGAVLVALVVGLVAAGLAVAGGVLWGLAWRG